MKNPFEVLSQKVKQIEQLKAEVAALYAVLPMLHDGEPGPTESKPFISSFIQSAETVGSTVAAPTPALSNLPAKAVSDLTTRWP